MSLSKIVTGSSSHTMHFEGGEQVYPCRCGEVHRGDYAVYDHGHHDCLHEEGLVLMDGQGYCPSCGMTWAGEEAP